MINFKEATETDVNRLSDFRMYLIANTHSHYGSQDHQALENIKSSFNLGMKTNLNSQETYFIFSEDNRNNVISMGIGIIDNRAPILGSLNGRSGWISSLIVHPNYRGQGLGHETLKQLLNWFESNQVTKVVLHSTIEGEFLYKHSGFIKDKESIFIKTF